MISKEDNERLTQVKAGTAVEQPMKFELVINFKTAQQIGLTIPQWTLMKADRVMR